MGLKDCIRLKLLDFLFPNYMYGVRPVLQFTLKRRKTILDVLLMHLQFLDAYSETEIVQKTIMATCLGLLVKPDRHSL